MGAYFYLFKLQVLRQLSYRFEALAGFLFSIIPLAVMVSLWRTAYRGKDEVAGVDEWQMVSYAVLAVALKDVLFFQTQDKLLQATKSGDVSIDLMRPYNVLFRYFAEDCALGVCTVVRRMLPLIVIGWLVVQPLVPASVEAAALFVPSILLSYLLLWLLSAQIGIVSLWQMEIGTLGYVKDAVVRVLSGSIVPIWFFPAPLREVSAWLPFQYTVQTPLGIFVGNVGTGDAAVQIMIQFGWVVLLSLVLYMSWRTIQRRITIQGG